MFPSPWRRGAFFTACAASAKPLNLAVPAQPDYRSIDTRWSEPDRISPTLTALRMICSPDCSVARLQSARYSAARQTCVYMLWATSTVDSIYSTTSLAGSWKILRRDRAMLRDSPFSATSLIVDPHQRG